MHKLQKFYGPLSGLNTRENKLTLDPNAFRTGSKNFRFNFLDEIQKANGFQHKSIYGFTSAGDIEYKYTDIDTGASKFQHLAVGTDGNLYRKYYQYIKFSSLGTASSYSFYYDEVADDFKLKFNSYAAISITETTTMDQLRIAINALGPVCTIVDENDATVTGSTKLAYLLDVVIDQALTVSTISTMNSQYWLKVLTSTTEVPFPTTVNYLNDSNYQGISYVNIDNICMITDGGWPMKYDGLVVYRAGQPKILAPRQLTDTDASLAGIPYNYSGINLTAKNVPEGNLTPNSYYQYVFQLCSVDSQGISSIGGYDLGTTNLYLKQTLTYGQNAININIPAYSGNFNWFRCRVKGGQNLATAGGTIDVETNHNLVAGQTLRIPLSNKQLYSVSPAIGSNASTTNLSAVITNISNTQRITVGSLVTGTNIQADSYVVSIDSPTQITISKTATATGNISNLLIRGVSGLSYLMTKINNVSYGYSGSGTAVSGSPIVTGLTSTANLKVGALVNSVKFSSTTRILSIDSPTQVTMTTNALSSGVDTFTIYGTVSVDIGETEDSTYGPNISTQYPFQAFKYHRLSTTSGSTAASVPGSTSSGITLGTTSGSTSVTVVSGPGSELRVGMFVDSAHFTAGTTITKINSPTDIVVSANATNTGNILTACIFNFTGYYVEGNGLAAGTQVSSQTGSSMTLSVAATANTSLSSKLFHKEKTFLIDGQTLSAGYVNTKYQNTVTDLNVDNLFLPNIYQGCYIKVWRSTANTSNFYHLIDLDIPTSNFNFIDTIPDTDQYLGSNQPAPWGLSRVSLTDAIQGSELPRACKYLSKWQNRVIQMGRPLKTSYNSVLDPYPTFYFGYNPINDWGFSKVDYVKSTYTEADLCDYQSIYWASSDSNDSFPQDGLHEFLIESNANDQITGGSQNKDAFFAFKSRSTGVLVGSLAENNLQLELLESEIGCSSHRSIQEVAGALIWLDQDNGFFSCVAGRLPVPIGFPISDYQQLNLQKLDYTKAVSGLYRKENLYFCAVGTTTFVYDYVNQGPKDRSCWYLWDRFDTKSFLQSSTGEFFLSDGSKQWKMKVTNTKYDFTDHKSAIPMVVNTSWLTQGAPTIDKQFINLWVNSIQGGFTLDFYQYQNFLDYSISELLGVSFLAESSAKKLVKVQFKAANPKISGVSFGMQNNVKNAFVRIQGFEVEYAAAFDSGEPKK